MVGIVIVSHSRLAAEGIRELAAQMAGPALQLIACGELARNICKRIEQQQDV